MDPMSIIGGNVACLVIGLMAGWFLCRGTYGKPAKPAKRQKTGAVKKASSQDREPLIKRPTKDKATWPKRDIEDVPELRTLPTDAELEAQQAKRFPKPKPQTKRDKKREPQRRTTWGDIFEEGQIPQEWQPVNYTPVAQHRAQFKQQLSEKQEGGTT